MYSKTIICFANSRKISGRCVAGRELLNNAIGPWIRPVSARPAGEVSEEDRRYLDGTDPVLLDVIAVPMLEPKPHGYQVENHLIAPDEHWVKQGRATPEQVLASLDAAGPLWENLSSGSNGINDRVEEGRANALGSSLKLIEVSDLRVQVAVEGEFFGNGKRKVRARFSYAQAQYLLAVTDPVMERAYLKGQNGEFNVGKAVLCVSLGEPYKGFAYKLVAAILL